MVDLADKGLIFQEGYRGKQLHHLIYKRKVNKVEDFSNCEQILTKFYVFFEYFVFLDSFAND